ncbi:MAG: glycoside hydrolase family 2, partial [Planctomycetes bacterium]|nr:glycoside hydrolase family 2 [Planctomycetota bacterium]
AEPCHVVRGSAVHLEAVLANEDVLAPGEYPVRLEVVGPRMTRVLDRRITVTIPEQEGDAELPLAQACFAEDVVVDGPQGKYRFLATFENKAAAAGGECDFYLTDPALMPPVEAEIVLWGEDPKLGEWLGERGIRSRPFSPERPAAREVILVAGKPKARAEAEAFPELVERIKRGASVVFLTPDVFAKGDQPLGWLPLANKGDRVRIRGWLYLKDEWAKRHPIFDGLQAGDLMDYTFYREIIPDVVLSGQDPPAEAVAGAVKASQDYSSGLTVAVYDLGAGRFILNTLRIRDNLGRHPAAERILRNMLNFAAESTAPDH